jgi:hypothetical protein
MLLRYLPLTFVVVACGDGSEVGPVRGASGVGAGVDDAGRTADDAGVESPRDISVAGTLVERLLNAPSKALNQTSWQGIANSGYLQFALYGDGFGSVSEVGLAPTDFSWTQTADDTITFSGNPWFGDLIILEFHDARTLIANSHRGGVFGQRWDLMDSTPGS